MIEEAYNGNDELIATKLKHLLEEKWPDLQISILTSKRNQKQNYGMGIHQASLLSTVKTCK